MAQLYLSIGSNIEPERHFQLCATALEHHIGKSTWSRIFRSAAVGMAGDDFLNAVVGTYTDEPIDRVCQLLSEIENKLGRQRSSNKFISRTMDIDLLLYDNVVLETNTVTLPRPEILTDAHVAIPLAELAAEKVHPVIGKTYKDIVVALEKQKPGSIAGLTHVMPGFPE